VINGNEMNGSAVLRTGRRQESVAQGEKVQKVRN